MTAPHPAILREIAYTITFLEMPNRPTRPLAPAPAGLKTALLRAERPTVSFYRYLYNTVGGPWLWHERRAMGDAALARMLDDPDIELHVLYVAGCPAGMAEIDRRRTQAVDLAYFGLIPDFIGRRLGPHLLDCAIDIGWRDETSSMTVNTCTLDHPAALCMYRKAGFQQIRREDRTIVDPRDRGLFNLPGDRTIANEPLPNRG